MSATEDFARMLNGEPFPDWSPTVEDLVTVMAVAISNSCATSKPILYINDDGGPGIDLHQLARALKR